MNEVKKNYKIVQGVRGAFQYNKLHSFNSSFLSFQPSCQITCWHGTLSAPPKRKLYPPKPTISANIRTGCIAIKKTANPLGNIHDINMYQIIKQRYYHELRSKYWFRIFLPFQWNPKSLIIQNQNSLGPAINCLLSLYWSILRRDICSSTLYDLIRSENVYFNNSPQRGRKRYC